VGNGAEKQQPKIWPSLWVSDPEMSGRAAETEPHTRITRGEQKPAARLGQRLKRKIKRDEISSRGHSARDRNKNHDSDLAPPQIGNEHHKYNAKHRFFYLNQKGL
jgi:hypothetical protein